VSPLMKLVGPLYVRAVPSFPISMTCA